jgi:curved DNA-binding protein CbpA
MSSDNPILSKLFTSKFSSDPPPPPIPFTFTSRSQTFTTSTPLPGTRPEISTLSQPVTPPHTQTIKHSDDSNPDDTFRSNSSSRYSTASNLFTPESDSSRRTSFGLPTPSPSPGSKHSATLTRAAVNRLPSTPTPKSRSKGKEKESSVQPASSEVLDQLKEVLPILPGLLLRADKVVKGTELVNFDAKKAKLILELYEKLSDLEKVDESEQEKVRLDGRTEDIDKPGESQSKSSSRNTRPDSIENSRQLVTHSELEDKVTSTSASKCQALGASASTLPLTTDISNRSSSAANQSSVEGTGSSSRSIVVSSISSRHAYSSRGTSNFDPIPIEHDSISSKENPSATQPLTQLDLSVHHASISIRPTPRSQARTRFSISSTSHIESPVSSAVQVQATPQHDITSSRSSLEATLYTPSRYPSSYR